MVWVFTGLIIVAIILFVFSMYKNKEAVKNEQREIDTIYLTLTDDIKKLQNEIQFLNIENEILSQKMGFNDEERELQLKMVDLYKKNFNVEVIASKLQIETSEVERLLAPYMAFKNEGSQVNES